MSSPQGAADADGAREAAEWVTAMRAGDFDRAWAISDQSLARVRRCGRAKHEGPRHEQRIWRGEELSGRRVLVRCYHGLGDTIQFIRFARPLRHLAREVVVWCQPELVPLVSSVEGVDLAVPLHDGVPNFEFDVDIELMEIPHAIRVDRDQVAMGRPYLKCPPGRVPEPVRQADAMSIGLVWQVGDWDIRRSLPPDECRTLNLPGVQLYSLQRGEAAEAAAQIGAIDISVADIRTLAGRLRALDLVICPDTMVAHLAAALGCETWVMLHSDCDWRWPARGSATPWYPTVRLFHQESEGGWSGVFERVRRALVLHLDRRVGQGRAGVSAAVTGAGLADSRNEAGAGSRRCK